MGTGALARPAERSSAIFPVGKKTCRALLDRTAEGGCPHACPQELDRRWWKLVVEPSAHPAATLKPLAQADHHNKNPSGE